LSRIQSIERDLEKESLEQEKDNRSDEHKTKTEFKRSTSQSILSIRAIIIAPGEMMVQTIA
jgi:hypothetical protein